MGLRGEEVNIPTEWGSIAGKAWGRREGDPVMCIHGLSDNAAVFDQLLQLMSGSGHFYLAIDLPGHGKSAHYPPHSPLSHIEYLADLRRVCGYYGWSKVTLLSHSIGCRLALYFAAVFPETVRQLLLLDVAGWSLLYQSQEICDILRHEVSTLIRNETAGWESRSNRGFSQDEAFAKFKRERVQDRPDSVLLPTFERSVTRRGDKVYFTRDKRNVTLLTPLLTSQFNTALLSNVQSPALVVMSETTLSAYSTNRTCADSLHILAQTLHNQLTMVVTPLLHDMHVASPETLAPILLGYMKLKNKL